MNLNAEGALSGFGVLLPTGWRSDALLLQQARAGERVASDELVKRLLPPAHALAWKLTGDAAESDDVVQEAFCRLWQHAGRFEGRAQLSTWFLSIVRNLCMDRFRRSRPRADETELESLADPQPTPEEHWQAAARSGALRGALVRLPERQRAALMMWAWQEYDVAAIARELGIADNAAHQLLFRARTRLKALLAGETDDD